jgi:tetratricopeptide (TPR) repeat protein
MSLDRKAALRAAEKLLRLGKLQPAIAEYTRLAQADPRDWDTGLFLASLHLRARHEDAAIAQFTAIADALCLEGDVERAATVYARILEARPGEEHALKQGAGLAVARGDTPLARTLLTQLAEQQIARGDLGTGAETLADVARLDPSDEAIGARVFSLAIEAKNIQRAREFATTGEHFRILADLLQQAGDGDAALAMLRRAIEQDPDHLPTVAQLARTLVMQGNAVAAAEYLTPAMAGSDTEARLALIEIFLRGGRGDAGLELAERTAAESAESLDPLARLACVAAPHVPEVAFRLVDLAVTRWIAASAWEPAAGALQQFVSCAPSCIEALVRLVEVAVDGDLSSTASHAQEMLADAYLATGAIDEGLAIAEDLAAREPDNSMHVARVRRAQELRSASGSASGAGASRGVPTILPFRVSAAS